LEQVRNQQGIGAGVIIENKALFSIRVYHLFMSPTAIVSLDGSGVSGAQLAREQTEQNVLHDPSIPAGDREKEVEKELAEPLTPRERVFITIDPLMYAGRVHCPALILHGGSDITVPIRSAEKIANAIRSNGNSDVTARSFPLSAIRCFPIRLARAAAGFICPLSLLRHNF
jgi:pimeloyl-ACP methyl ester carboxylesterase